MSWTGRCWLEFDIGLGVRLVEVARVLGVQRRTVDRCWARIEEEVRIAWFEPDSPRASESRPGRAKKRNHR